MLRMIFFIALCFPIIASCNDSEPVENNSVLGPFKLESVYIPSAGIIKFAHEHNNILLNGGYLTPANSLQLKGKNLEYIQIAKTSLIGGIGSRVTIEVKYFSDPVLYSDSRATVAYINGGFREANNNILEHGTLFTNDSKKNALSKHKRGSYYGLKTLNRFQAIAIENTFIPWSDYKTRFPISPSYNKGRLLKYVFIIYDVPALLGLEYVQAHYTGQNSHLKLLTPQPNNVYFDDSKKADVEVQLVRGNPSVDGVVTMTITDYRQKNRIEKKFIVQNCEFCQLRYSFSISSAPELFYVEVSYTESGSDKVYTEITTISVLSSSVQKNKISNGTCDSNIFGLAAAWNEQNEMSLRRILSILNVKWLRHPILSDNGEFCVNYHVDLTTYLGKEEANREKIYGFIKKNIEMAVSQGALYFEFGNEWNLLSGQLETSSLYLKYYLEIISKVIEDGGHDIKILAPSVGGGDVSYLKELLKGQKIDGFNIHAGRGNFTADFSPAVEIGSSSGPEYWNFRGTVESMEKMISQSRNRKPLFITEAYAPTNPDNRWGDTMGEAADNLLLTFAIAKKLRVKGLFWYQLNNGVWWEKDGVDATSSEYNYGLLNSDLSLKPSALAYAFASRLLEGANLRHDIQSSISNINIFSFQKISNDVHIIVDRKEGYVQTLDVHSTKGRYHSSEAWKEKRSVLVQYNGLVKPSFYNSIGQFKRDIECEQGVCKIVLDGAPVVIIGQVVGVEADVTQGMGSSDS